MRTLYSLLFYFLIPFILIRLLWRSLKAPAYRHRWNERLGIYTDNYPVVDIWFHSVSVGETEALFPLVKKIQQNHPEIKILITTTTPTGSARVISVLKDSVEHVYLPYDIPLAVNRFIRRFQPKVAVILETEIWPNLFAYCGKYKIPLYIINARLSEKSYQGYQKIRSLIRPALLQIELIGTQTEADAERFIAIGAEKARVKCLGNVKFDIEITESIITEGKRLKKSLFSDRFVWLIASTHQNEEAIFLDIYPKVKAIIPELILVVVPRHPERFGEVTKLCEQKNLHLVTRSSASSTEKSTDVFLVDSMGELKTFYVAAEVAFVGGSMVPKGGHNILEPAAAGIPVMFGPYMANFKDIAAGVLKQNAAIQCQNEQEITAAIVDLYANPTYRQDLISKGKQFIEQNQGAVTRVYEILDHALANPNSKSC